MEDEYYKTRYIFDSKRRLVWKEISRFLEKFFRGSQTIVDLGAGYCDFINNVSVQKRYAIDISPELPKYAGEGVIQINRAGWDLSEISDSSVDVVHASNFLEHFDDEEIKKIFKETKRMLKPGGKLILMQPNYRLCAKHYFDDPTHKKVFDDSSLESLLLAHDFKVILKKPRFLPFSMRSNSPFITTSLLPLIVRAYIHSPFKPFAGQMLFVAEKL
jgi:SAM-dependent methyltransferase